MKLLRSIILVTIFCVCLTARGDFAVPPGTVHVEAVFAVSNLVCSCYVESVEDRAYPIEIRGKPSNRHEFTAHVLIRDIYKSEDPGVSRVTVQYTMDEQQGQRVAGSRLGLTKANTVLLFLSKTGTASFEFSDPFIGATEFSSLPVQKRQPGPLKLQHALVVVAQNPSSPDQLTALRVLLGFDHITDDTVFALTPLTQSSNPDTALTALGVLLRTKSVDSVEKLQRYLESYRSDAEPLALFVIGPELSEVNNVEALPALEGLSASRIRVIRSGAMDGLRRIHSQKSVPLLVSRLDDPDGNVQYVALITLAEILGKYDGDYAPSMYLFDKKPTYYINLWKQWWADEGSKIYTPPKTQTPN